MQHHAQSRSGFHLKRYVWSTDLSVVCEIGCKFALHDLFEWYAVPPAVAQELMGSRQRLYALTEPGHIVCQRAIGLGRLDNNCADRREHVLDPVVEFSKQRILVRLRLLASSDINVDANDALRAAIAA